MNPLLRALRALGGSGSIDEIYERVIEIEKISEAVLSQMHDPEGSNQTEVGYRLAWARTYLKKYGHLDNSARGVWSLTAQGRAVEEVDPQEVLRKVRSQDKKYAPRTIATDDEGSPVSQTAPPEVAAEETWKQRLFKVLTQSLAPAAFERLVQRILRESGFVQVEVTGKTGDGGIDGRGIARINGLMSFHVLFQCKRYKGSVSSGEVRDFRGAMVGRADKGLFITTGTFSPAAVREATRDGAPPIDLIDGNDLSEKLKELGLGITKEVVEVVKVDEAWFAGV
ncbi:MAG: restriction endonuclease [Myxococcales bacterium]|nr:restriction endonuclease [Myxococcales bacterium]